MNETTCPCCGSIGRRELLRPGNKFAAIIAQNKQLMADIVILRTMLKDLELAKATRTSDKTSRSASTTSKKVSE